MSKVAGVTQGPPADWEPPRLTIFIAGAPRTGSTLLCAAIKECQTLGIPREFFNLASKTGLKNADNYVDCCKLVKAQGMTSNGVAAAKIFARHLEKIKASKLSLDDWFPDQSWVYLRRRDALGQAISWVLAEQTGKWEIGQTPKTDASPTYTRAAIENKMRRIENSHQFWQGFFARSSIKPLELWYEDFAESLHPALISMARQAGGEHLESQLRAMPSFQAGVFGALRSKQRNTINVDWRMRFLNIG